MSRLRVRATGALVQAAAARNAVPVTLELGGKSPQMVSRMPISTGAPFLVNAGIQNAGQTCSASSRILVEEPVYGEVIAKITERFHMLDIGPAERDLDAGR